MAGLRLNHAVQANTMGKDLFDRDVSPPHPGEILREDILPRLGLTRLALAQRLGISTRILSAFLNERRPVTLDLAIRLGSCLGHGARYWLGLQAQYDMWHAAQIETSRARPHPSLIARYHREGVRERRPSHHT